MLYDYYTLSNWEAVDVENILTYDVIPNLGDEYEEVLGNIIKAVDTYVDLAVRKGIDPEVLYTKLKDIYILKSQDEKVLSSHKLTIQSIERIDRIGNTSLFLYPGEHTSYIIEMFDPEDFLYTAMNEFLKDKTQEHTITLFIFYTILRETPFGKEFEAEIESRFAGRILVSVLEIKNEDILEFKLSL